MSLSISLVFVDGVEEGLGVQEEDGEELHPGEPDQAYKRGHRATEEGWEQVRDRLLQKQGAEHVVGEMTS